MLWDFLKHKFASIATWATSGFLDIVKQELVILILKITGTDSEDSALQALQGNESYLSMVGHTVDGLDRIKIAMDNIYSARARDVELRIKGKSHVNDFLMIFAFIGLIASFGCALLFKESRITQACFFLLGVFSVLVRDVYLFSFGSSDGTGASFGLLSILRSWIKK